MELRNIQSWEQLALLLERQRDEPWIYRGVNRGSLPLLPKVGRSRGRDRGPATGAATYEYEHLDEKMLFDEFRRRSRPLVSGDGSLVRTMEYLAIAQHHGLATRLLDWTESLLVAAFFATEAGVLQGAPPAIYGIRDIQWVNDDADPFAIDTVSAYRPPHLSPRIAPQHAVFTIHPIPTAALDDARVFKWTLDVPGTYDLKWTLDVAGISRASLFPDLDGLASALNWRYKWKRRPMNQ